MPDISKVWLNKNAVVETSWFFPYFNRQISLTGEAYFEVKHNPKSPFVVQGINGNITVLGTSFNYMTSKEGDEISLYSGSVEYKTMDISSTLAPGQKLSFSSKSGIEKGLITNTNLLFWKTQLLEYHDAPLHSILKELEVLYEVDIEFSKKDASCPISIVFEKQSIDEVLDELSYLAGFRVEKDKLLYKITELACE